MKKLSFGLLAAFVAALLPTLSASAIAVPTAVFGSDVAAGVVGTVVAVHSVTPCVKPVGALLWTAIVEVAQGGNGQLTYVDFNPAVDGSWSGSIVIPVGAVPGSAQLTATCFDAATSVTPQVAYAPVPFTVTQAVFGSDVAAGVVGTVVAVHSVTPCVKPVGALLWTAIVEVAQGGNGQLTYVDFNPAVDGSWSGSIVIPVGAVPGSAQLTATCFDAATSVTPQVAYAPVPFTVTQAVFGSDVAAGVVGTVVAVHSVTPCVKPVGALLWTAIVEVAQGGNGQLTYVDFNPAVDGSWSGSIVIPVGAVPGSAQLTATCFDAATSVTPQVAYAPVPFTVTQAVFGSDVAAGVVGTVVAVHSVTPCVKPVGALLWTAIVEVAQGGNGQLTYVDFNPAVDGSWSGSIVIPVGAVPGSAQLTATCFDAATSVTPQVAYAPVPFTVTAGVLDHLVLTPAMATIATATAQPYAAEGFDAFGNDLGDMTGASVFTIAPEGSCSAASCTAAAVGAHTVSATDGTAGSTKDATLTVIARSTTTSVGCTPSPVPAGGPTTCTATVSDASGGSPSNPTGTVRFTAGGGGAFLGSPCSLNPTSGSITQSTCSVAYSSTAVGTHTITARSSGDVTHQSSTGLTVVTVITATSSLSVSQFTDPTIRYPWVIVSGPDGALWFTDQGNNSIGRITTAGTVTNYTDPTINTPYGIAAGPDGALWFTNFSNSSIGRITTGGIVTNYADPTISVPTSITTGPDGALWFTNHASNSIGRITTVGTVTNFTDSTINMPTGIATGPDGALWFTNFNADSIGRITTAGVVTAYTDPSIRGPAGITGGGDGALWFTNSSNNSIGRITTGGVVTNHTDPSINTPTSITVGSDGALWFNNVQGNSIGRITTAGVVTSVTDPSIYGPESVAAGADGAIWFTNFFANSIGRISGSKSVVPTISTVSPNAGPTGGGQTVTITGAGFVPGAIVRFGNTLGSQPVVVSATQMTVVSPVRPAGAVNVLVTTIGGTSPASSADRYLFGGPTVTSIGPNGGPIGGATVVTIRGTNFVPGATVAFGAIPAASVTYNSSTTLHATAPAGAGVVDVTVTTPAATSLATPADRYVFGAPTVSTVSPNAGPVGGGSTVTITGAGFVSGATVKFGNTVGTNVIVISSTRLTVVTPVRPAGMVDVFVVTRGGTSAAAGADHYTYS